MTDQTPDDAPPPPPPPPPSWGTPGQGDPQPQWNPQTGWPQQGQPGQDPVYPQQTYPQVGWAQSGQPFYGSRPTHPRATTAMVLGLVGTVGGFFCLLPIVVAPFALVIGAKARREIKASQGQYDGEGQATAGFILGIVGTVLLALGIIAIVVLVIVATSAGNHLDDGSSDGTAAAAALLLSR